MLKKQLVQLAATAQVRVTHRVDNKSRQMSKPMMIRRLIGAKFGLVEELAASSKSSVLSGIGLLSSLVLGRVRRCRLVLFNRPVRPAYLRDAPHLY